MKKQFTELIGVCFTLVLLLIGTSGAQAQYCDAGYSNTSDDWIARVEFAGIDNESGSVGYEDFTSISGVVAPGATYPFTATIGFGAFEYTQFVTVFIDFNQDEVFDEVTERFDLGSCGTFDCSVSGDIEIPGDAIPGETRMRVIEDWNNYAPTSCVSDTYGEVEDYTIAISGDCVPPLFDYTSVDDCENQLYDVEVTMNDFSGNAFITVYLTRSDDVELPFVTLPFVLEGQTIVLVDDVPFGVTVQASIEGSNPQCNGTRNWSEEGLCPPPNNDCETAIALDCNSVTMGSSVNGSAAPEGTPFCGEANLPENSPGVWYTWTSDGNNLVNIGTQNSFVNDEMFVYTGECGDFECILGLNFSQFGEFNASADETYYIFVTGFNGANGDFELVLDCTPIECDFPGLTAVAVDADGNEIEGCISVTDPYRVEVMLTGGAGNASFTVQVGDSVATMVADQAHIFGVFGPGSTQTVTAIGDDNPLCNATTTVSTEVCPPENDDCENAQAIGCDETVFGTNIGANLDFRCAGVNLERQGVWYALTLEQASVVNLETCHPGTSFDTDISVFTGECGDLTCFNGFDGDGHIDGVSGCEFAGWAAGGPNAVFNGEADVTYYILVHGFGTGTLYEGVFELSVACEPILCITPEMTVETVLAGGLPIDGCLDAGTETFVNVDLAGGEGNDTYTVSATYNFATVTETLAPGEGTQFGPYPAGSSISISALGDQDGNCEVFGNGGSIVCPPPNDFCADAIPLPCNGTYVGNTLGATDDVSCNGGQLARGVWFVYTADANIQVALETCNPGTNYDTNISVFTGDCDELTCLDGFGDGFNPGFTDGVFECEYAGFAAGGANAVLSAEPGVTYYILVHGWGTGSGDYELSATCINQDCAPAIVATAVDANELPIEDCVDQQGEYYVLVDLSGGLGNDFYSVAVNGGDPITVPADGSGLVGPIAATIPANVVAYGQIDETCAAAAEVSVALCPPSNDVPCGAIPIDADGSVSTFTNVNATADEGEVVPPPVSCQASWCTFESEVQNSVWFTFIAPESGRADISLCGPNTVGFDTQVAVWSVEDCGDYTTYTHISSNDDAGVNCSEGGLISITGACLEPGEEYYVQVDGYAGQSGSFDISVTPQDGEICSCVVPVFEIGAFTATTDPICDDLDNPMFSVTFYTPEDLGSQDGIIVTYDWTSNEGEPSEALITEATTMPELFPLGDVISFTMTLPDEICMDLPESIFPYNAAVSQDAFACDEDCEGVPGGGADPGTPCDLDGVPGVWNADCECIPVPANDLCADAEPIECGDIVDGSTATASNADAPAFCGTTPGTGGGVWYSITGTGSDITASLCGSAYDTKINVYEGPCGELVCVTGIDDFCGLQSEVTWASSAGVEYLIYVNGFGTASGDFTLTMTCEIPGSSIDGTVDWNASCGDRDVLVSLYAPGTSDLIDAFAVMVNDQGQFTVPDVIEGTYDVIVKVNGYLAVGNTGFVVAAGSNALDMGAIQAGDLNSDNGVNIVDVSIINGAFNSSTGDANYNPLADMNCDGGVNIIDVSIINSGFGSVGVEAPLL